MAETPEAALSTDRAPDIEKGAKALAALHYAVRFAKKPDDPHVLANVKGNWHRFCDQAGAPG